MNWVFENFQIVLLVVLAFVSWLKHRADVKTAEREEREAKGTMAEEAEMWEETLERRPPPLEPTHQRPPPLSLPRTHSESQQRAAREAAVVLEQQLELQERLRKIRETRTLTTGGAAATQLRVTVPKHELRPAGSSTGLRQSLRKSKEIRRAIVLREILGPPIGLR